jgi:sarcosine oxidase subunit delta
MPVCAADIGAFAAYVYERANPRGWHLEWWYHAAGCRQYLQVWRHTVTHDIHAVGTATASLPAPPGAASP